MVLVLTTVVRDLAIIGLVACAGMVLEFSLRWGWVVWRSR